MSERRGDVLFIGMGATSLAWYRAALPAMFLGADWIGVSGEPPKLRYLTGLVRNETVLPRYEDYSVVIVQQARGRGWLRVIRGLQSQGIKVLYEIDDYVHAIRKMADHDFKRAFTKDDLADMELCMRVCDGLIVSTDYLARRYRAFNRRVWVCENGLDLGRYRLTRPDRPTVNVIWAGATGHRAAVLPWVEQVGLVMERHKDVCFVSIGQDYANTLRPQFGTRTISVPFTLVDQYPAAMTLGDIAIAPAGKTNFHKGKSDLRWIEAGALGIPTIADPVTYPHIDHGVNGFHASTPAEAGELLEQLVTDAKVRLKVGDKARAYVEAHRDMRVCCEAWRTAIDDVLSEKVAA